MSTLHHPAFDSDKVRHAVAAILDQLERPFADTWGCTLAGHLVTIVERLGHVSTAIQDLADVDSPEREKLAEQIAELGANVLVMLAEELRIK